MNGQRALSVQFAGSNYLDNSLTLAVDGVRYEYFFANDVRSSVEPKVKTMLRASQGRALTWTKRTAIRCVPVGIDYPANPVRQKVD